MKPSVILYKTLPDDLQQRLEQHFTVTQVKNLRPETVSQHAEAFAQAEGLLGSSEKVDAALLEKILAESPRAAKELAKRQPGYHEDE